MTRAFRNLNEGFMAKSTLWKVGLYQALLLVVAVAAWRVLQAPSTMAFFVLELGIALAGGLFLGLRRDMTRARVERTSGGELVAPRKAVYSSERERLNPEGDLGDGGSFGTGYDFASTRRRRRSYFGLSSLFLVAVALASLNLSRSIYTATLEFFLLIGIAGGVLALNIWVSGEKHAASLLGQMLFLAALVKFYFLYLNPYVYTSDYYLFFLGLHDVTATGYLQLSLGHYYFFPGFATFSFSAATVGSVPLELFSAFGLASQIGMIPVIYLIGRYLANRMTGLFASLFAIFSVFTFLSTQTGPTQYGLVFIFLAIYAAIRIGGDGGRIWFVVFWISALAAMLSHPINALVLALILAIRVAMFRSTGRNADVRSPAIGPAFSYGVVYGAYLVFIAYTAFDTFVRSLFVVDYAPPLATTPVVALERTPLFALQSALGPLGLAIPVFFAGYAILARLGIMRSEHPFLVTLGAVFIVIPGLEVLGENFRLQTSRMLIYLAIPLVILSSHGLVSLLRAITRRRRAAITVLALFLALAFVASSSYLTLNDSRLLYTDVPAAPVHTTESALLSQRFLKLTPENSTIYMEFGSWRYFANTDRAVNPLHGRSTPDLASFQELGGNGFVVLNQQFLAYGTPSSGSFYDMQKIDARVQDKPSMLVYDSGSLYVYYVP